MRMAACCVRVSPVAAVSLTVGARPERGLVRASFISSRSQNARREFFAGAFGTLHRSPPLCVQVSIDGDVVPCVGNRAGIGPPPLSNTANTDAFQPLQRSAATSAWSHVYFAIVGSPEVFDGGVQAAVDGVIQFPESGHIFSDTSASYLLW